MTVYSRAFEAEEVRAVGDSKREFRFTLGSSERARDGHRINLDKMDVKAFRANPVMLWAHDSGQLPLGIWKDIEVVDGPKGSRQLRATAVFEPEGLDPFTDRVCDQVARGVLKMCSIRWRTIEAIDDPEDQTGRGLLFTKSELLEASIVPIGADTRALRRSFDSDQDLAEFVLGVIKAERAASIEPLPEPEPETKPEAKKPSLDLAKIFGLTTKE